MCGVSVEMLIGTKVEYINCRNSSRPKFLRPWLNNISQMLKSKTIVSILTCLRRFHLDF